MNEIRVWGRVKVGNRGKIHGIRHDECAGALGIKVGNGLIMVGLGLIDGIGPLGHACTTVIRREPQISTVDPDDKQDVAHVHTRWGLEAADTCQHGGAGIIEVRPVVGGVKSQSLPLRQHLNPDPTVGVAFAVVIWRTGCVIGRGGNAVAKNIEVRKSGLGRENGGAKQQNSHHQSHGFFHAAHSTACRMKVKPAGNPAGGGLK